MGHQDTKCICGMEYPMPKWKIPLEQEIEWTADWGDVVTCDTIFVQFGLEESIDKHTNKRDQGHTIGRLSRLMVDNYCTERKSKRKIPEWYAGQQALQERLDLAPEEIGEQDLYRPLDYLTEEVQQKVINDYLTVLAARYDLSLDVILEDSTSTYFEGEECEIAEHGYSRDHRPDLLQVNIEYGLTQEGLFPIRQKVHPGSVPDNRAIDKASDELREQHPNLKSTLVVDRGMSLLRNRRRMIKNNFDYVAGLKLEGDTRKLVLSVSNDEFKEEIDPGPGKEKLKVVRREGKVVGRKVINHIFYNQERARREKERRKKRIKAAYEAIAKLQEQIQAGTFKKPSVIRRRAKKRLKKHRVHAYFRVRYDPKEKKVSLQRREEVFARRELLDGKFVIQTTQIEWTSGKVLSTYRSRSGVEDTINILKNLIEIRPIRHWNEQRVKAHIFLCTLAFLILCVIRYAAQQARIKHRIETLMTELRKVKMTMSKVSIEGQVWRFASVTGVTRLSDRLFHLLGVELPSPSGPVMVEVRLE